MTTTVNAPSPTSARRVKEPPVLGVQNLCLDYVTRRAFGPDTVVSAVKDVSFDLCRGQTIGLVGESGCGKSSLLRTIMGINAPTSGAVTVDGVTTSGGRRGDRKRVASSLQMVFQDPYSSLDPAMTVHEIIAEPLAIAGRPDPAKVLGMMDKVGLHRDFAGRLPSELSGGQRQRVGIARALVMEPKVLILDEPVSALDVSVQAQVINLLQDLQDELGISYLFVAHDLSVVRHVSDIIAVMYLGRIVEYGPAAEVFANPHHPYTKALLAAIPASDPGEVEHRRAREEKVRLRGEIPDPANVPSGCPLRGRCPEARKECASIVPALTVVRGPGFAVNGGAPRYSACPFGDGNSGTTCDDAGAA